MKKYMLYLLCSGLFLFGPFSGLTQKQKEFEPERHEVTVSLVLVDIVATDKKGEFVTQLTKEDFEAYEDGKQVPINSLELVRLIKEEAEVEVTEELKPIELPKREKHMFVIFDSINTIRRVLEEDKQRIIERLNSLIKIGRKIMVLELSETEGMQVLQPFSTDERVIAEAVKKAAGSIWLEKEPDHLVVPSILEKSVGVSPPRSSELMGFNVDLYKMSNREIFQFFARQRFEKTINGLLAAMNLIKDYPGRKPVLLISGGIPSLTSFQSFGIKKLSADSVALSEISAAKIQDPFRIFKKSGTRLGEDIFNDFTHFANSHNITFYTLDPDNYLRYLLEDIAYENFPRSAHDVSLFKTDEIHELKKNELNNLNNLASDTGGAAFMGAKKFENFQKVVNRDLSYLYELSYFPPRKKADGKYHRIEIKVKQPDIKIAFRKGYFDYTEEQRASLLFASASYNPALFKQISFQARAVPFVQSKNKYLLWLNMALPVKGLILGDDESETLKKLKLNITFDDLGDRRGVASQVDIPIMLTPSFRRRLQKAEFFGYNTCSQELALDKDKYRLIFALYDEHRRQMGTVEQTVDIHTLKSDAGAQVFNIVFGNLVKSQKRGQAPFSISQRDGTLQLSEGAFYPMSLNQFRPRKNIALFLQAYSPHNMADFNPRFSLLQDGIEKATLPAQVVEKSLNKKASVWNAVVSLDFSEFTRGDYILSIKMTDSQTKQEVQENVAIKII